MRILAIDTATQLCGVALLDTDSGRLARRQQVVTTHSESLLSLVTACLAELDLPVRDLSVVALGAGPGSFTGLRIGCATAKGLCYALSIPLCMVSSLLALAQPLCGSRSVLATQDAFRGQVYARLMPSLHASPGLRKLMEQQPALLTDAAWNPDELATLMMPFSGELLLVGGGRCGIRCYRRFPMWRSIRLWHPIRSWLRASVFRLWPRENRPFGQRAADVCNGLCCRRTCCAHR